MYVTPFDKTNTVYHHLLFVVVVVVIVIIIIIIIIIIAVMVILSYSYNCVMMVLIWRSDETWYDNKMTVITITLMLVIRHNTAVVRGTIYNSCCSVRVQRAVMAQSV
jgi:hypothetical protein